MLALRGQPIRGSVRTRSVSGARSPAHGGSRRTAVRVVAATTAAERTKLPANVEGDIWVDQTCIDCDTCRGMSPTVFTREAGQSAVTRQPTGHGERVAAIQALLSCPTFSIHADARTKEELQEAQQGLPRPIPGVPDVFLCGWNSVKSYGATTYLIRRPEGNILVDSPRFSPVLARQIEALGGVRYMFMTHKDDVADHDKWASHFKAVRILHKGEVKASTAGVEIQLEGEGPWPWSHVSQHPAALAAAQAAGLPADASSDFTMIHTPGHTRDHVCLYSAPHQTLFSGDHLCSPEIHGAWDQLYCFKNACWYDFDTQMDSVAKLLDYDFLHVLPGHGRQAHFKDALGRLKAVTELLQQHGHALKTAPVAVRA